MSGKMNDSFSAMPVESNSMVDPIGSAGILVKLLLGVTSFVIVFANGNAYAMECIESWQRSSHYLSRAIIEVKVIERKIVMGKAPSWTWEEDIASTILDKAIERLVASSKLCSGLTITGRPAKTVDEDFGLEQGNLANELTSISKGGNATIEVLKWVKKNGHKRLTQSDLKEEVEKITNDLKLLREGK